MASRTIYLLVSIILVFATLHLYTLVSFTANNRHEPKIHNNRMAVLQHEKKLVRISRKRYSSNLFSKHRCIGDDNSVDGWRFRVCVFENVCYDTETNRVEYYADTERPIIFDKTLGHVYDFEHDGHGFVGITFMNRRGFAPKIVYNVLPTESVTMLDHLHSWFAEWLFNPNLGHFLWEDLLGHYAATKRIGIEEDPIVISTNGIVYQPRYAKFMNFSCGVSDKPFVELANYTQSFQTRYVCFKRLQAGGSMPVFQREHMAYNIGKEALFESFRVRILKRLGFDPDYVPTTHKIVVTKKKGGNFGRSIYNLAELVEFLKDTYPDIPVQVVEWSHMTIIEQIQLLQNTTILITPAGGVSMMAPFLPHGAHAIFMDYYVSKSMFGYEQGESGSMEAAFWGAWPYLKKSYYQIRNESDYRMDAKGYTDARWYASVIVKMDRIRELVDRALEDMEM